MPNRKSIADAVMRPDADQPPGSLLAWSVFAAALGAVAVLILAQLPLALVLPALSTLLVVSGFGLAASSYLKGMRMEGDRAGSYEIAGALVFLGFAAALLTDSEQALALFERIETQGLAALAKYVGTASRRCREQLAGHH